MRIYISATQRDLRTHRLAVAAALRRMGHEPIGMEDYVAEGMRPLRRCLADVNSADVYVGIVAWRYGYVPKEDSSPSTLPVGSELGKTSITEFEFRQAVQFGKPTLIFLLDPDAEWPSTQFDAMSPDGDQGKAVSAWRHEIGQQYLISYFRTPEELASLVSAAVYRTEMNRQMVLESLRLDSRFNEPFIRNGPVVDSTLAEIKNVIAGPQGIDALQVNVGQGFDWWMTRLYFLASLAAELTSIEVMVFVGQSEEFVGIVHPQIVRERLVANHPILGQYEISLAQAGLPLSDLMGEIDRRAGIWSTVMNGNAGGEQGIQVFVNTNQLDRWFKPYLITEAIEWDAGGNTALQIQRLLDWPMRFVPVVEKGKFSRVVDKRTLAQQVARLFVREQVSRALSMVR